LRILKETGFRWLEIIMCCFTTLDPLEDTESGTVAV